MSEFSERRVRLAYVLSLFTSGLAFVWFWLARSMDMVELGWYILAASLTFVVTAFLSKNNFLMLARIIYMIVFNVSVTITASYVGKAGSVEFILMFSLALPFIMFSFRRERHMVWIFSSFSGLFWVLLYLTDFTLFADTPLDPELAGRVIYPVSIASTILLVTYQLVYFSFLNARFYSDIHSQREVAEEASNAKSRFLSTMSHEIRTPLNAIIGLSHILTESNPKEEQRENLEALTYSGNLLLSLLNNVLDFSKMEVHEMKLDPVPTDLSKAMRQIQKVHEPNAERKNIAISINVPNDLPTVWLDVVRFNQVANNLISNAIKFTDKGEVFVKMSVQNQDEQYLEILTEVVDSGIGIPKNMQAEVFEAFAQAGSDTERLYGGTGLGLPIVQKIVESMGSQIELESETGKGSRFFFTLKLKIADHQRVEKAKEDTVFNLDGKHILLVEDNQINIMVARQILEKAKLNVDVAENGKIAVDRVKENNYDVILMDIQMPVMDGYQASTAIREFNKDIPILALSASVYMEVKDQIFECGMNGFIFKPFEPNDLLRQVEKAVNGG